MIGIEITVEGLEDIVDKLSNERMTRAMGNAMRELSGEALTMSRRTTATWKHKPNFELLTNIDVSQGKAEFLIGTDDKVYHYLDKGTGMKAGHLSGKYPIPKVLTPGRKMLRFQTGYNAKTAPNVIGSTGGGAFGPFRFARRVWHPGISPRNFTKRITQEIKRMLPETVSKFIRREWRSQKRMKGK
jgi:hypothetical protein